MNLWEIIVEAVKKWWEKEKDKNKPKPPAPEPTPEPPKPDEPDTPPEKAPMPDPSKPENYRRGFLWKPIGDGGRPAVVLLPSAFTFNTEKKAILYHRGTVIESSSRAHNGAVMPNGNREHYRWDKKGASYPNPIDIEVKTLDGNTWGWRVPSPADRHDSKITPTVRLAPK